MTQDNNDDRGRLNVLLETLSLILLPPMYFFAHVYYTDIPSITMILFTIYFSIKRSFWISSIFGFLSVLMRQTNVVWIGGILGRHILEAMIKQIYPKLQSGDSKFSHLVFAAKLHMQNLKWIVDLLVQVLREFTGYFLIIIGFVIFLIINGSIVGKEIFF
jgi:alpha-1,2-glucosyltransferase